MTYGTYLVVVFVGMKYQINGKTKGKESLSEIS